jgi:hypothetical protein
MKASTAETQRSYILRVLLKASLLFLAVTLLFGVVKPIPWLEKISVYNLVFPGRERLPFGEVPDKAYNLSLYQLDAMFEAHQVAAEKAEDEYRILTIGDSSIWGFLLPPEQTVSAQLNRLGLTVPDGRRVQVYNLGYPTISLTKDLLMLSRAEAYQPDLVIWFVTLEAFPKTKQFESPIVQNNAATIRELIAAYELDLDAEDPRLVELSFWQNTLIGQRRALADLLRLQLYGMMWSATGIDQYYPKTYEPPQHDLQADLAFQSLQPPVLKADDLSLDMLEAGIQMIAPVPVMIVNEPIYLSDGENSNIRYNFFYPRWAYDDYRQILTAMCNDHGWQCLDTWNLIPPEDFTNSAIHYNADGAELLASEIAPAVQSILDR